MKQRNLFSQPTKCQYKHRFRESKIKMALWAQNRDQNKNNNSRNKDWLRELNGIARLLTDTPK